jgi:DNA polymerase III alpha subunit (gram-positive type)
MGHQPSEVILNAPVPATITEAPQLKTEANALLVPADFKITSVAQYTEAGARLTSIKAMLRKIESVFQPHITRAHEAHKALVAERRVHETLLLTAETRLKSALVVYQNEQERIRLEQEAKLRAAADAEAARIREQAAQAEAAARTKAEELRRQQEEAARAGRAAEAARLAARATATEEKGAEKAAVLQERAAMIPTPVVEIQTPKVEGVSTRETWNFEITDRKLVPDEYKSVDERKIGAVVRAMKEATNIPGVRVFKTHGISAKAS